MAVSYGDYHLTSPAKDQLQELVDIRLVAMKPSLVAINRYDPARAAKRFSDKYNPETTKCIVVAKKTVGFYVLAEHNDHLLLDHFYLLPDIQSLGIGTSIIESIKKEASLLHKPIRLCALRGSQANEFYQRHGFEKTHETEIDIFYQCTA